MTDLLRRNALQRIFVGALVSVTSYTLVEAAWRSSAYASDIIKFKVAPEGATSRMRLKSGQYLDLTKKGGNWYASSKIATALKSTGVTTPTLELSDGKILKFDRDGRLMNGKVPSRSFLECVKPDCT